MEVENAKDNTLKVCFYEMLGSLILFLGVNWGNNPAAVALALYTGVMITGSISGAHHNPAVTLGVLFADGCEHVGTHMKTALAVIFSQVVGMSLGAGIIYLSYTDKVAKTNNVAILLSLQNK